jgi:hypothetical protein
MQHLRTCAPSPLAIQLLSNVADSPQTTPPDDPQLMLSESYTNRDILTSSHTNGPQRQSIHWINHVYTISRACK